MAEPTFAYQFRLMVIGDSAVGKTSLLKHFTLGKYEQTSVTTDPTCFTRTVEVEDGTRIKLQLWDTARQDISRSIPKISMMYYINSVGALLVYDISNRASFEHISSYISNLKIVMAHHKLVIALVGCKVDLINNEGQREVSSEEAKALANRHGLLQIETCAKYGINVEKAFKIVTQEVYNRCQRNEYKLEDQWSGIKKLL